MDVRRKGYTVFEVMVTIAVAVVIASISLPFIARCSPAAICEPRRIW